MTKFGLNASELFNENVDVRKSGKTKQQHTVLLLLNVMTKFGLVTTRAIFPRCSIYTTSIKRANHNVTRPTSR